MERKDYDAFASEIIKAVGGPDNIESVTHCMTRLRFVLNDENIVNDEEVKKIKGVLGVMHGGGQYQIPIGTYVDDFCPYVLKKLGDKSDITSKIESSKEKADKMRVVKKDSWYNRFFKVISGCILPSIGPMAASGIIKGILTVLLTCGVLHNSDGTYIILYAASDALMYFFPIIVGFSAGKVFDMNPYTSAVIGAALLYPTLAQFVNGETALTFMHIPVKMMNYSQSVLPIILAAYVASKIEKLCKKILPRVLQLMFVPAITLAVSVPLTLIVVGPLMTWVSLGLANGVNFLYQHAAVVMGGLLGAFWQLFVMMGIHAAMIPIIINNLMTLGYCPINAILGLTVWALAGINLGYALKIKNKELKATAFGNLASALCGITEPTIYTVALTNMKRFVAAFIGGGIAGIIGGILKIKMYVWAGDGLFRIPGMINPSGLDVSFWGFLVCAAIAFGVSAVLSFIVTDKEEQ